MPPDDEDPSLDHARRRDDGEAPLSAMRPQHELEAEGGPYGRLPSLDASEVSGSGCCALDEDANEAPTVPLHELYGSSSPIPPPRLLERLMGRPPRIPPIIGGPRPSTSEAKLSRIDEGETSSQLSRDERGTLASSTIIDEAPREPPRSSAVQRLAGVLLAACTLGGLARHQFVPHDHPTLQAQPPTMPPAQALANSTQLLLQQVELESQLASLERSTSGEESHSHKRLGLLAELLRSHRASATLHGSEDADAIADVETRLRGAARYGVGEAVEQVFNANTLRNRVLYPFRVEDVTYVEGAPRPEAARAERRIQRLNDDEKFVEEDSGDDPMVEEDSGDEDEPRADDIDLVDGSGPGIRYTLVRLLDGFVVKNVPESFLRRYEPYEPGARALCNLGDDALGQIVVSPCRVVEYLPPDEDEMDDDTYMRTRREAVKAEYRVKTRRPEGEEVEANLPIGKLQMQLL